jgi:hypothetical protein
MLRKGQRVREIPSAFPPSLFIFVLFCYGGHSAFLFLYYLATADKPAFAIYFRLILLRRAQRLFVFILSGYGGQAQ